MDYIHRKNGAQGSHWIGDGTLEPSGGSCSRRSFTSYKVPVKALNIIWGNDSRFWQREDLSDDDRKKIGFTECAVLLQVNWMEVTGKFPLTMFKANRVPTKYEVMYHVKFRPGSFSWSSVPVKFKVRINGTGSEKIVLLGPYSENPEVWHQISGGEFILPGADEKSGAVLFGMFEVDSDKWKGGLVLGGVTIEPKN